MSKMLWNILYYMYRKCVKNLDTDEFREIIAFTMNEEVEL